MALKNDHRGFSAVEAVLILVIVGILGFTGWFVWHAQQSADKTLNSADKTAQSTTPKVDSVKSFADCKKAAGSKIQETYPETCVTKDGKRFTGTPKLIDYGPTGVNIQKASDITKLTSADQTFKDFILSMVKQSLADNQQNTDPNTACEYTYTVNVSKIYAQAYATGGVSVCGGYAALWAKVDGSWKQIAGTQEGFTCDVLMKYKVPSVLVGDTCNEVSSGTSIPYNQD